MQDLIICVNVNGTLLHIMYNVSIYIFSDDEVDAESCEIEVTIDNFVQKKENN